MSLRSGDSRYPQLVEDQAAIAALLIHRHGAGSDDHQVGAPRREEELSAEARAAARCIWEGAVYTRVPGAGRRRNRHNSRRDSRGYRPS